MIGASAAVSISDVPFNGPIAGIVLGWDGEKYLFNPTQEQRKTNRMTTTIAATHKKIVMIESEADQVPDDVMYEGIVQAHEHLQPVLDLIDKMVSEIGKPKFEYEHAPLTRICSSSCAPTRWKAWSTAWTPTTRTCARRA